jgi:hypothetical protein
MQCHLSHYQSLLDGHDIVRTPYNTMLRFASAHLRMRTGIAVEVTYKLVLKTCDRIDESVLLQYDRSSRPLKEERKKYKEVRSSP